MRGFLVGMTLRALLLEVTEGIPCDIQFYVALGDLPEFVLRAERYVGMDSPAKRSPSFVPEVVVCRLYWRGRESAYK